jgi:hypothetical protein
MGLPRTHIYTAEVTVIKVPTHKKKLTCNSQGSTRITTPLVTDNKF